MAEVSKGGKVNTGAKVIRCPGKPGKPCTDPGPNGQDALYGEGKRLANGCAGGWRCTVCGTVSAG